MIITSYLRRGKAGLLVGLLLLGGAGLCYRQFLQAPPVSIRVPVPLGEMQAADGFGVKWRLPATLRAERWHRTGVRVRENGRLLPLRVAGRDTVIHEGQGRFFVEEDGLWFSASDNSRPDANRRSYELEVLQPAYGAAGMAAIWLAGAVALGSVYLPWRKWGRNFLAGLSDRSPVSVPTRRALGWICWSLAGLCLAVAVWPQFLKRSLPIPTELLMERADGQFACALPRWLRNDPLLLETAGLLEGQQPLRRVSLEVMKTKGAAGGFLLDQGHLLFRASDSSNPSLNGRTYRLEVCLMPAPRAWLFALILGGAGLLLWIKLPRPVSFLASHPSGSRLCWWAVLWAVAFGKLFVIAGDEMVATESDASWYARSAMNMIWGSTAGDLSSHPSGFPLLAGMVAQFGIPWRLALEILYLGACFFLATSIHGIIRSRLMAFVLFLLVAWHPWTFAGFRDFMSEPVVLVLWTALLAAMFRLLNQPVTQWTWSSLVAVGLLLFFWEWSRHEELLVYASYGYFVALVLLLARIREPAWAPNRRRVLRLLALPVLTVLLGSTAVKGANYCRFGLYAKSMINSPGLIALMKALYRIKPDQELRYAPVTRQSLRAACEVSPSLKSFEIALFNLQGVSTRLGEQITRVPGEFGSYLNWLLPNSLPGKARVANAVMFQAAAEINLALREGKLPARRAFFPLDPNWHLWLPDLWPCFLRRVQQGMSMAPVDNWGIDQRAIVQHLFDKAANRRAAHVYPGGLLLQGLVSAPRGTLDSVVLADKQGGFLAASALSTYYWNNDLAFDFRVPLKERPENCQLIFFLQGKPRHTAAILLADESANHPANVAKTISGQGVLMPTPSSAPAVRPSAGETMSYQAELIWEQPEKKPRREAWNKWLTYNYPTLVKGLLIAVFAGLLLSGPWERPQLLVVVACCLLATGWMVGRAALYALVDANTGWGAATRYMQCTSPVYVVILLLATVSACALVKRFFVGIHLRYSLPEQLDGGQSGAERI